MKPPNVGRPPGKGPGKHLDTVRARGAFSVDGDAAPTIPLCPNRWRSAARTAPSYGHDADREVPGPARQGPRRNDHAATHGPLPASHLLWRFSRDEEVASHGRDRAPGFAEGCLGRIPDRAEGRAGRGLDPLRPRVGAEPPPEADGHAARLVDLEALRRLRQPGEAHLRCRDRDPLARRLPGGPRHRRDRPRRPGRGAPDGDPRPAAHDAALRHDVRAGATHDQAGRRRLPRNGRRST